MVLMANGPGQRGSSSSSKKGKKEKKKGLKPNDVCCDYGGLRHWRNQLACPKHKEKEG